MYFMDHKQISILLVLNVDSHPKSLHPLMPPRMAQRYHSAPIYFMRPIVLYKFLVVAVVNTCMFYVLHSLHNKIHLTHSVHYLSENVFNQSNGRQ